MASSTRDGRPARDPEPSEDPTDLGLVPGSTDGDRRASLTQTRVDRFLSSPQRIDVGMIGGEAGHHLRTLSNDAAAADQDIDVPGGLTQPVECRLIGAPT